MKRWCPSSVSTLPHEARRAMRPLIVTLKSSLKNSGLSFLGRISRRHMVMLPPHAGNESMIFDLRSQYRAEDPVLIELRETTRGSITATLLGYNGHFPTRELWRGTPRPYAG